MHETNTCTCICLKFTLLTFIGCLPESSQFMHYPQMSLMEYIDHHQNFVGRNWLSNIIKRKLFDTNATKRGIILEAGMGYGKSVFLKHIICSSDNGSFGILRSRLVAFLVCRFDVSTSKQMFIFVFRLINMISSQIPFINDAIKACFDIYDHERCKSDPTGCLDQCLIKPLKGMPSSYSRPVIIIIDGLDECFDKSRNVNDILFILRDRMYRFPSWVKFVVSSRPDPRLEYLNTYLQIIKLNEDSLDNLNDIDMYQKHMSSTQNNHFAHKNGDNISNFLLMSYLIHNSTETLEEGETFPRSLHAFYDTEFQRLFTRNQVNEFNNSKVILEVMSSSFESLTRNKLWYVISNVTSMTLKQFNFSLQELNIFFRNIGNEIHFFHLSFQDWLLSEKNIDFKIDIENGHNLHALYLFNLIENGDYEIDIVDLAIHVDLSMSEGLCKRFLKIPKFALSKMEQNKKEYPLFGLVRRRDSFEAANLLMSHFQDFETRNKDNLTALYIAASLGHVKAQRC